MISLDVRMDVKRVNKALTRVQRREVPKSASRALNRAIKASNTQAARRISKRAGIKPQRKVREQIRIIKASWRQLEAKLVARGRALNLIQFVTPSRRKPGAFDKKRGVQAKAWGEKKTYPGTFIGRGQRSGKTLVFKRQTAKRTPIRAVHGPSVPIEFQRREVSRAMEDRGREAFRKEFLRDLRRRLARMGLRG